MKWLLHLLILSLALGLSSCQEDETSQKETRLQAEITQRVEMIRTEMKSDETRWHTIRVACFCLLAGGSLIGLMTAGESPRRLATAPTRGEPQPGRRVIDRSYDDPYESENDPYRR
ncbi:MAG: hypothetical protein ABIS50_16325 [Luteolibacter sp.]|uniref:hypothetical protein n=1 Tax=Luteolibacter sp. TaxID=1962973 RepID=UPI003266E07E